MRCWLLLPFLHAVCVSVFVVHTHGELRPRQWLDYCNVYMDLRHSFCNGAKCETNEHSDACQRHFRTIGQLEGRRRPSAPMSPKCDPIPFGNGDFKCGPRVLIIGAMKCGTNTLGSLISMHPRVKLNSCRWGKCPDGFGQNVTSCSIPDCRSLTPAVRAWQAGYSGPKDDLFFWEQHYFTYWTEFAEPPTSAFGAQALHDHARLLPDTDGYNTITVEKAPSYLDVHVFKNVTQLTRRLFPNAKILVSLCNPTERLLSEYQHMTTTSADDFNAMYHDAGVDVPADFAAFVNMLINPAWSFCSDKPAYCATIKRMFLEKGQYDLHLQTWMNVFGRENVLVVGMDEARKAVAHKILNHVGLPVSEYPWEKLNSTFTFSNHENAYRGRAAGWHTFKHEFLMLSDYYKIHLQRLGALLGPHWTNITHTWNHNPT
eukprot:m.182698 g.182698  ORF g.182698 m.182698 type:complete len:429 (+) comp32129_c0_seq1:442-1728(+)